MTTQEKLKRLYVLLLINNASLKLAKADNNPESMHECTDLGLYLEALFLRVKKSQPITKQGMALINQAPMLLKEFHVTPKQVEDAKKKGLFNI